MSQSFYWKKVGAIQMRPLILNDKFISKPKTRLALYSRLWNNLISVNLSQKLIKTTSLQFRSFKR